MWDPVRRPRGQRGATLIEVIIALGVMMPLTLAGAIGILTAVEASSTAERRQELEVALSTGTELVRVMPYLECGSVEQYQDAYRSVAPERTDRSLVGAQEATPVVAEIQYWDDEDGRFVDRCRRDGGAQRLTVRVVDAGTTAEATVVKRVPAGAGGAT